MRSTNNEFSRFVLSGTTNAVVTYGIYLLLLLLVSYLVAYSIAYVSGVFIAYYLNSRFVFNRELSWKGALRFPLIYPVQYLFGVIFLHVLVEVLTVSEVLAPFVVVVMTTPITYFLTKAIIKGPRGI